MRGIAIADPSLESHAGPQGHVPVSPLVFGGEHADTKSAPGVRRNERLEKRCC